MPTRKITLRPPCILACITLGLNPSRMSAEQVASLLGVLPRTVQQYCKRGRIESERFGRGYLITSVAVDKFLANPPPYGPKLGKDGKAVNPRQPRKAKPKRPGPQVSRLAE